MTKVIKILGTGCAKCDDLMVKVKSIVAENKIDAVIEKVEDVLEIMDYDIIATPGLVVDNELKFSGKIPSDEKVLRSIK